MTKELFICLGFLLLISCSEGRTDKTTTTADTVISGNKENILVSDSELRAEESRYSNQVDELFDDFLYNYIHDNDLRQQRTIFPLSELYADGTQKLTEQAQWTENFDFMTGEYSTNFYSSEQDKALNEQTDLNVASLEKIDLDNRDVAVFNFMRINGKWQLRDIRHATFEESDMGNFLNFYYRFVSDPQTQSNSLASRIHVSMMDPDDDSQTIDGFITRDQWTSLSGTFPQGIITNIRYGQQFTNTHTILLEKVSMGDGMSETFTFSKTPGREWKLVGYEY